MIDLHQHLWPAPLLSALRSRPKGQAGPRLDGWTLRLPGEPDYQVNPLDHDPVARAALDPDCRLAGVSLSAPLGIEALPPDQGAPLLAAWHAGARDLPAPFRAWASVADRHPDLAELRAQLADPAFVGLQIPATALAAPAAVHRLAPVLQVCQDADRPVLVHPGPVPAAAHPDPVPGWWTPAVDYPAQLQAAWWAWADQGRSLLPAVRICFVAGAGLAPLHHERVVARGGPAPATDPLTFVEISSYGPRAVAALARELGVEVLVNGTDRPYAGPADLGLDDAGRRAVTEVNPARLLGVDPIPSVA